MICRRLLNCLECFFHHSPPPGANDEKSRNLWSVTQGFALGYLLTPLQGLKMGGKDFKMDAKDLEIDGNDLKTDAKDWEIDGNDLKMDAEDLFRSAV